MKEFPSLLILIKLWNKDWEEQLDRMNNKVDEENGIGGTQENGQFWKLRLFQGTNSGRTLGVFCQHLPLALNGQDCEERIQR